MGLEFTRPLTGRFCETDYVAPAVVLPPEASSDSSGETFSGVIE